MQQKLREENFKKDKNKKTPVRRRIGPQGLSILGLVPWPSLQIDLMSAAGTVPKIHHHMIQVFAWFRRS